MESYIKEGDFKERLFYLVKRHEEYRVKECLNLRADENYTISAARNVFNSDISHRNTSPDPRFKYRGTRYIDEISELTISLGKKLFKTEYINVLPPTGHTANIVTFFTFCKPGDKVLVLDTKNGGYGGLSRDTLPKCLGLEIIYFPFDEENMNIDVDQTIELIKREKPTLIIFGATYFLFPQPISEIAQEAHKYGGTVAYDGSHVMGLIAGGQFQDPLNEGADLLFGSTMKTMAGPPGGILLTNDKDINDRLFEMSCYKAITSPQWNRVAALGMVFAEMLEIGQTYASQVVENARELASCVEREGIGVMFKEKGYTSSHMFLLDVGGMDKNVAGKASAIAAKLEEANIIIDDRGRVGLAEVTHLGMKKKQMEAIAKLMSAAIQNPDSVDEIRTGVRELKAEFYIL